MTTTIDVVHDTLREAADGSLSVRLQAVEKLDAVAEAWPAEAHVRILRNFTVDQIVPLLKLAGYRLGLKTHVALSDYGTYQQEVLDPSSALHARQHELVVLALWLDNMPGAFGRDGELQAGHVAAHVEELVAALKERTSSYVAVNTFLPPAHAAATVREASALAALNQRIRVLAEGDPRLFLVDLEALARDLGTERTTDPRYWYLFKSPLRPDFLARWGDLLAQAAGSVKGRARKVLVLDCDNTLWGGIVGEDGLEGIALGPNDYPGSAFYAFQRQILALQREGVMLALCSKNNEADVMEVLERHPQCLIRREHLAGWRIDWNDKATNLRALAADLNVGIDSFVFLDDNPTECELIRATVQGVEVLQVPARTYELPSLLRHYSGFVQLGRTAEDANRTAMYAAEKRRQEAQSSFEDLDAFLGSLDLRIDVAPPKESDLARVAQLTQKTNQFNLTTRRYTVGEIERLARDENALILRLDVADRFGDYGTTGVAIAVREGGECRVDTLLMSCRVLGKKVEQAFVGELVAVVRERWGALPVVAEFVPTKKNAQVADFYDRHGFTLNAADESGRRIYRLQTGDPLPEPVRFITITRG